jgi:hypothetical protein
MATIRKLNWGVIAPLGLLGIALAGVLWLGFASSGEAQPPPYLADVGTPIRFPYDPEDETPTGTATPRPRPTFTGNLQGTAAERDAERRNDLLQVLSASNAYREANGEFISTNGNIQTLCAFQDVDAGCALAGFMGGEVPIDPSGEATRNGYWYQSDGRSLRAYAALELEIPDAERCDTNYVDFRGRIMICIAAP